MILMTKEKLEQSFHEAAKFFADQGIATIDDANILSGIYTKMFGLYPQIIDIDTEGAYLNKKMKDDDEEEEEMPLDEMIARSQTDEIFQEEPHRIYRFKSIDNNQTFIKIIENNPECVVIRSFDFPIIIKDKVIIFWHRFQRELRVMQDQAELYDWIGDNVVEKSSDENHLYFDYATYGQNGFDTIPLEIKKQSVDIETNYNDDLPNREILEFLASKESGLLILHGIPGTGKTSYIRHLMYTLFKKEFLVLDNSVFNYITDSSFISLLMDYKDAVIILEDCESMLTDRTQGNNRLSALLNLSDGIIGDSFNFKFICTFNANIGKIDKALLRKGRMKLKYEFKELSAEKTKALAQKLGKDIKEDKPMTLANIYNYGHNNDRTDEERSIGFRK